MFVEKKENGLYLELEPEDSRDYMDVIGSDDLFWNDLYFYHSQEDGWQYLYDVNTGKVIPIDDYGINRLDNLIKDGNVLMPYSTLDHEDFKDYEWNQ